MHHGGFLIQGQGYTTPRGMNGWWKMCLRVLPPSQEPTGLGALKGWRKTLISPPAPTTITHSLTYEELSIIELAAVTTATVFYLRRNKDFSSVLSHNCYRGMNYLLNPFCLNHAFACWSMNSGEVWILSWTLVSTKNLYQLKCLIFWNKIIGWDSE